MSVVNETPASGMRLQQLHCFGAWLRFALLLTGLACTGGGLVEAARAGEAESRLTSPELPSAGQAGSFGVAFDGGPSRTLFIGPDGETSGLPLEGLEPMLDAERAIQEELEIGPRPSFPLNVSARLTENGARLPEGLVWRVFRAEPRSGGTFDLVDESHDASPSFLLPADDYIVHVAYGLANAATLVSLKAGPVEEEVTLEAGALRITSVDAGDEPVPGRMLTLSIYAPEEDDYGQRRQLIQNATPGAIIRLNPGTYHVVSYYGDANSVIRADVQVKPGELTDARIQHRAAAITFKLVHEPGGEALADTEWTILSPGGETVKESFGAFPTLVLVEGNYALIARHGGRMFNREFDVVPGRDREVELVAR